jgi:hypothetical protein
MIPPIGTQVLVYLRQGDTDPMLGTVVGGIPPTKPENLNIVYWHHYHRDQWRQANDVPPDRNDNPDCLHGLFWMPLATLAANK